jgi:hypothetical protein
MLWKTASHWNFGAGLEFHWTQDQLRPLAHLTDIMCPCSVGCPKDMWVTAGAILQIGGPQSEDHWMVDRRHSADALLTSAAHGQCEQ